ncbi:MAG TPA: hypothetical protein PLL66_08535, partial [Bacteroidales bacterium]|nr:hypothetical protein [Bacteroidales bacterium]
NSIAAWLRSFEPLQTVIIGPEREYKSMSDYFSQNPSVSNVYVLVEPGTYYSDSEIWISGNNIVVEGIGEVNHYCNTLYTSVMCLVGENILIKNLHLQHTQPGDPEHQNCSGRVIMFDNASDCIIDGCDLNGCGLAGLHDNLGNKNILIKNCYIHNNSLGAYTDIDGNVWQEAIDDHPVFQFENNTIKNNGYNRVPE